MENTSDRELQPTPYEAPRFEVISLSCEISAYAPDDSPPF